MIGLFMSRPAFADQVSNFYKQQTITIHVGFERGSSYDKYSRLLAQYLSRHIPGNPAVRVENSQDSGGLRLANLVYNLLPQDGTVIANIAPRMAMEPLFGNKSAKFDPRRLNWLGSMNKEVTVCAVWNSTPVNFWQDLLNRQTVMGGATAGSFSHRTPILLNNIFGTRIRLITAYPGEDYINSALKRGELDGRCGWSWAEINSSNSEWLRDKKIRILLQTTVTKHLAMPKVPLITDFAKSKKDLQILKLIYGSQIWGRPYFVGPRVPAARVATLQDAFEKTMTDKEFLDDGFQRNLNLDWNDGITVQKAVSELYVFPKDAIAAAVKATTNQNNTQISRAVIPLKSALGKITKLQDGGQNLSWDGEGIKGEVRLNEKRTKITINGKRAKLNSLKPGMICKFTYRARTAKRIACE